MADGRRSSTGEGQVDFNTLTRFFNKQRKGVASENVENGGSAEVTPEGDDEALTAEFRARLGLLPDNEEALTDAFKAHLGLNGLDEVGETAEITLALDWEKDATIASFKFSKFVAENFQGSSTLQFAKDAITEPLLQKEYEIDRLASLVVWLAIQRFMGDAPSAEGKGRERATVPVMTKIYRTLETQAHRHRRASRQSFSGESSSDKDKATEAEFEPFKMRKRSSVKKLLGMVSNTNAKEKEAKGKEKMKRQQDVYFGNADAVYCENRQEILNNLPGHEMDLIHFITGHGILRREMRDEILCQLCKQLTNNPSQQSIELGWMMMGYCLGCFLPSNKLLPYLKCFLKDAPIEFKDSYVAFAKKILGRTLKNGVRYHPPNWLEYQAVKMKKNVVVPVTFATGRTETIEADAATTAAEMCALLANKLGLKDQFGFSIYIAIYDKVSSLGSGLDHVMDAISECEQVVRTQGIPEQEASWALFLRKELFSPWHDPSYDDVSTDLIYTQFRKGLRCKEYRIRTDDELAKYVTQIYFVENNGVIIPGKLQANMHHYIPSKYLTGEKTRDVWTATIISLVDKLKLNNSKTSIQSIKESLIMDAAERWTIQFSGLFEAFRISGPLLPKNDVVIAINHKGLAAMHEPFKVCLGLEYYKMVEICSSRTSKQRGQCFSISTVSGEEYTFMSPNAQNITSLVNIFLEGLRRRSKYAVGLKEFVIKGPDGNQFGFHQGDLLTMIETVQKEGAGSNDWVYGLHEDSGTYGTFPLDMVYILPTMVKPPKEFLNLFVGMSSTETQTLPRRKGSVMLGKSTIGRHGKKGKESLA